MYQRWLYIVKRTTTHDLYDITRLMGWRCSFYPIVYAYSMFMRIVCANKDLSQLILFQTYYLCSYWVNFYYLYFYYDYLVSSIFIYLFMHFLLRKILCFLQFICMYQFVLSIIHLSLFKSIHVFTPINVIFNLEGWKLGLYFGTTKIIDSYLVEYKILNFKLLCWVGECYRFMIKHFFLGCF